MNREELLERTRQFAHRCVKLALVLPDNSLGNHIRSQLIRSSTGVGANYRAACVAQSRAAFVSKLSIVIEVLFLDGVPLRGEAPYSEASDPLTRRGKRTYCYLHRGKTYDQETIVNRK
jgi:hypothetical protein